MNQPKRTLKINMIDLIYAFEFSDPLSEVSYYLDLETGEILMTTGDVRRRLEEIYEEYGDPETGEVDWSTILPGLGIPEWQQDELVVADRVEAGFGERFIAIPHIESWEGYREADFSRLQQAIPEALSLVANNQDPERGPRGGIRWTPRQSVRRVAWHTLDHAWEIEDRIVQSLPG
ncbi:MAG: hypothetical protein A2Z16_11700 [Chloroflexi bacterium RBG_16_54_18]|nr:MAG: hypothetical protein A2Z16_11700 [Chloroflexi bacterium RBG_16_54_18]HJW90242.1 hypothetical protein [Anaerolineales bacterium]